MKYHVGKQHKRKQHSWKRAMAGMLAAVLVFSDAPLLRAEGMISDQEIISDEQNGSALTEELEMPEETGAEEKNLYEFDGIIETPNFTVWVDEPCLDGLAVRVYGSEGAIRVDYEDTELWNRMGFEITIQNDDDPDQTVYALGDIDFKSLPSGSNYRCYVGIAGNGGDFCFQHVNPQDMVSYEWNTSVVLQEWENNYFSLNPEEDCYVKLTSFGDIIFSSEGEAEKIADSCYRLEAGKTYYVESYGDYGGERFFLSPFTEISVGEVYQLDIVYGHGEKTGAWIMPEKTGVYSLWFDTGYAYDYEVNVFRSGANYWERRDITCPDASENGKSYRVMLYENQLNWIEFSGYTTDIKGSVSVSFSITEAPKLVSAEILTYPKPVFYKEKEWVQADGMVVRASYDDGSVVDIEYPGSSWFEYNLSVDLVVDDEEHSAPVRNEWSEPEPGDYLWVVTSKDGIYLEAPVKIKSIKESEKLELGKTYSYTEGDCLRLDIESLGYYRFEAVNGQFELFAENMSYGIGTGADLDPGTYYVSLSPEEGQIMTFSVSLLAEFPESEYHFRSLYNWPEKYMHIDSIDLSGMVAEAFDSVNEEYIYVPYSDQEQWNKLNIVIALTDSQGKIYALTDENLPSGRYEATLHSPHGGSYAFSLYYVNADMECYEWGTDIQDPNENGVALHLYSEKDCIILVDGSSIYDSEGEQCTPIDYSNIYMNGVYYLPYALEGGEDYYALTSGSTQPVLLLKEIAQDQEYNTEDGGIVGFRAPEGGFYRIQANSASADYVFEVRDKYFNTTFWIYSNDGVASEYVTLEKGELIFLCFDEYSFPIWCSVTKMPAAEEVQVITSPRTIRYSTKEGEDLTGLVLRVRLEDGTERVIRYAGEDWWDYGLSYHFVQDNEEYSWPEYDSEGWILPGKYVYQIKSAKYGIDLEIPVEFKSLEEMPQVSLNEVYSTQESGAYYQLKLERPGRYLFETNENGYLHLETPGGDYMISQSEVCNLESGTYYVNLYLCEEHDGAAEWSVKPVVYALGTEYRVAGLISYPTCIYGIGKANLAGIRVNVWDAENEEYFEVPFEDQTEWNKLRMMVYLQDEGDNMYPYDAENLPSGNYRICFDPMDDVYNSYSIWCHVFNKEMEVYSWGEIKYSGYDIPVPLHLLPEEDVFIQWYNSVVLDADNNQIQPFGAEGLYHLSAGQDYFVFYKSWMSESVSLNPLETIKAGETKECISDYRGKRYLIVPEEDGVYEINARSLIYSSSYWYTLSVATQDGTMKSVSAYPYGEDGIKVRQKLEAGKAYYIGADNYYQYSNIDLLISISKAEQSVTGLELVKDPAALVYKEVGGAGLAGLLMNVILSDGSVEEVRNGDKNYNYFGVQYEIVTEDGQEPEREEDEEGFRHEYLDGDYFYRITVEDGVSVFAPCSFRSVKTAPMAEADPVELYQANSGAAYRVEITEAGYYYAYLTGGACSYGTEELGYTCYSGSSVNYLKPGIYCFTFSSSAEPFEWALRSVPVLNAGEVSGVVLEMNRKYILQTEKEGTYIFKWNSENMSQWYFQIYRGIIGYDFYTYFVYNGAGSFKINLNSGLNVVQIGSSYSDADFSAQLTMEKMPAAEKIELVASPDKAEAFVMSCANSSMLRGTVLKVTFDDGSTEEISYGSAEWLNRDIYATAYNANTEMPIWGSLSEGNYYWRVGISGSNASIEIPFRVVVPEKEYKPFDKIELADISTDNIFKFVVTQEGDYSYYCQSGFARSIRIYGEDGSYIKSLTEYSVSYYDMDSRVCHLTPGVYYLTSDYLSGGSTPTVISVERLIRAVKVKAQFRSSLNALFGENTMNYALMNDKIEFLLVDKDGKEYACKNGSSGFAANIDRVYVKEFGSPYCNNNYLKAGEHIMVVEGSFGKTEVPFTVEVKGNFKKAALNQEIKLDPGRNEFRLDLSETSQITVIGRNGNVILYSEEGRSAYLSESRYVSIPAGTWYFRIEETKGSVMKLVTAPKATSMRAVTTAVPVFNYGTWGYTYYSVSGNSYLGYNDRYQIPVQPYAVFNDLQISVSGNTALYRRDIVSANSIGVPKPSVSGNTYTGSYHSVSGNAYVVSGNNQTSSNNLVVSGNSVSALYGVPRYQGGSYGRPTMMFNWEFLTELADGSEIAMFFQDKLWSAYGFVQKLFNKDGTPAKADANGYLAPGDYIVKFSSQDESLTAETEFSVRYPENYFGFDQQPEDVIVKPGKTGSLTAKAGGNSKFTYEWQKYDFDSGIWKTAEIAGADSDTIKIAYDSGNFGQYRCVAKNEKGVIIVSNVCWALKYLENGSLYAMNAALDGYINTGFYFLVDSKAAKEELTAEFVVGGETILQTQYELMNLDGNLVAKFELPLSATQMAEKIKACLKINGEACMSNTASLEEYAQKILKNASYAEYHELVKAMLNYGAYAQKYFKYDTKNLATKNLTDFVDPVKSGSVKVSEYGVEVQDDSEFLTYEGFSLECESGTNLKLYFSMETAKSAIQIKRLYSFSAGKEKKVTVETEGTRMIVTIPDLSARELSTEYRLTITGKTDTADNLTVSCSAMSYVNQAQSSTDSALKYLMRAMYYYNKAANELRK